MGVRITESRIPGGIANVERLGEIKLHSSGQSALVSYLKQPLKYVERTGRLVENTYAVMYDNASSGTNHTYKWSISLFRKDKSDPFWTSPEWSRDSGVFCLTHRITDSIFCLENCSKISVNVAISDGTNISMKQAVKVLSRKMSGAVQNNVQKTAGGGDPSIFTEMASLYGVYLNSISTIDDSINSDPNNSRKADVLSALLYAVLENQKTSHFYRESRMLSVSGDNGNLFWEDWLNTDNADFDRLASEPVGPCCIKPEFLATILNGDYEISNTPLLQVTIANDETKSSYIKKLSTEFKNKLGNKKYEEVVDLYNLSRFPKSAIRQCGLILDKIKESLEPGKSWNELIQMKDMGAVSSILNKYFHVFGQEDSSPIAKRASAIVNSQYIRLLSARNDCSILRFLSSMGIPDKRRYLKQNSEPQIPDADSVRVVISNTARVYHVPALGSIVDPDDDWWRYAYRNRFSVSLEYLKAEADSWNHTWLFSKVVYIEIKERIKWDPGVRGFIEKVEALRPYFKFYRYKFSHVKQKYNDDGTSLETVDETEDREICVQSLRLELGEVYRRAKEIFCSEPEAAATGVYEQLVAMKSNLWKADDWSAKSKKGNHGSALIPPDDVIFDPQLLEYEYPIAESFMFYVASSQDSERVLPKYNYDTLFFSKLHNIHFVSDKPTALDTVYPDTSPLEAPEDAVHLDRVFSEIFRDAQRSLIPLKLVIRGYADKNFVGQQGVDRKTYNNTLSSNRAVWAKSQFKKYLIKKHQTLEAGEKPIELVAMGQSVSESNDKIIMFVDQAGCGHGLAPGIPGKDSESSLIRPKYRDVRMVLMPLEKK